MKSERDRRSEREREKESERKNEGVRERVSERKNEGVRETERKEGVACSGAGGLQMAARLRNVQA